MPAFGSHTRDAIPVFLRLIVLGLATSVVAGLAQMIMR